MTLVLVLCINEGILIEDDHIPEYTCLCHTLLVTPIHSKRFTPYNILKMHCTCTVQALYKYNICTVQALYKHCTSTVYTLYMHCTVQCIFGPMYQNKNY